MTAFQDLLADRVYLVLELMSDVGAANLGQHVAKGKPGHAILEMQAEPPHMRFRRRYNGCHNDATRRLVILDGLGEIREMRYARHPSVDCQTLEGRLTVGRDERPVHVVAHAYGYTERHVHRLRAEARKHEDRYGKRSAA